MKQQRRLRPWVYVALDVLRTVIIMTMLFLVLWIGFLFADIFAHAIVWTLARFCRLFGIIPL